MARHSTPRSSNTCAEAAIWLALAKAALAEAEANLKLNIVGLDATRILAPFCGYIGAPSFCVGSFLETESGQTLAEIVQFDPILVSYDQPYGLLLQMHDAAPSQLRDLFDRLAVRATLPTGEVLPQVGRVRYTDSRLDEKGDVTVWAEFENPDAILVPGLKVELSLSIEK